MGEGGLSYLKSRYEEKGEVCKMGLSVGGHKDTCCKCGGQLYRKCKETTVFCCFTRLLDRGHRQSVAWKNIPAFTVVGLRKHCVSA